MVAWSDRRRRHAALATLTSAFVVLALVHIGAGNQSGYPAASARKHVLAWADVRNGYQHDSISHAMVTIERLGWESGLYDTFIRTDSQLITRQPVAFPSNVGIASSVTPPAPNLNYFNAIFFFGVREIGHRTDGDSPIAWAKDSGKGRVFYSTLGHDAEMWDNPMVRTMYFEAIKWALGLVPGATTPIPKP